MLGVLLGWDWMLGAIYAGLWLGALAVSRRSSVGGLTAAVVTAGISAWINAFYYPFVIAAALFVVWKHRDNIRRIIAGTEPRVGQKAA